MTDGTISVLISEKIVIISSYFARAETPMTMIVTAWNNGQHMESGAGYGLKIGAEDRDRYFKASWKIAMISLPGIGEDVVVNVAKESFWNDSCRELISSKIGKWMRKNDLAPWPIGKPPKFGLEPRKGNKFSLRRI